MKKLLIQSVISSLMWGAMAIGLPASGKVKPKIDEKRIVDTIAQLSDDRMEGRKSGEASGRRAEEFLAGQFGKIGLAPAGADGTYFQKFRFPLVRFKDGGLLRLFSDEKTSRTYAYGDDYYFCPVSGSGHAKAELVFVGYGISRPDKNFDEYRDQDVGGKIVLCLSGAPRGEKDKWDKDWTDYAKADQAIHHNALGLLLYDPSDGAGVLPRFRIWVFNPRSLKKGLVFMKIGKAVVDGLFDSADNGLDILKERIDSSLSPQSLRTGKILEVAADAFVDMEGEAANVIGRLEGADPELKDEVLIISGHLDGGGQDPDGVVYNGANDNASGIGVLLEIARVLVEDGFRPKRTILFIGWAAEELGGYGSKHFIEHPLVPLGKVRSVFVADCVGLSEGQFSLFGAGHFYEAFEEIRQHVDPSVIEGFRPMKEAGSDQYVFQQKEIPSFFAHNVPGAAFGQTAYGHTPQDDVTQLNPKALKKVAEFICEAVVYLADK